MFLRLYVTGHIYYSTVGGKQKAHDVLVSNQQHSLFSPHNSIVMFHKVSQHLYRVQYCTLMGLDKSGELLLIEHIYV